MDLIFTDKNRKDLGVVQNYSLDEAFGTSENNFELKQDLSNYKFQEDMYIYIEDTEYGGVIDTIQPNQANHTISYIGRTWHGILNSKIIQEKYCDGDLHDILREIISYIGLDDLFRVRDGLCGIESHEYQFRDDNANQYAYDGICSLFNSVNAKLKMKWKSGKVELWAELIADYSIDEEFDSSTLDFRIKKTFNVCNHLIVIGKDSELNKKIIHLFTDEEGNIQNYSLSEEPKQDSDYILDESKKLLYGIDEIVQKLEQSISPKYNYLSLETKPDDWRFGYVNYYKIDESENTEEGEEVKYNQLKQNIKNVYNLLYSQPYDWETGYNRYFYRQTNDDGSYVVDDNGDIKYSSVSSDNRTEYKLLITQPKDWNQMYSTYYYLSKVEGGKQTWSQVPELTQDKYVLLSKAPSNWNNEYGNYYYKYSTGTEYEWRTVSGVSYEKYVLMTQKPSDWSKNWKTYYCLYGSMGYTYLKNVALYNNKGKAPKWKKNSFFRKDTLYKAPKWKKNYYYKKTQVEKIPAFNGSNWGDSYPDPSEFWAIARRVQVDYPLWEEDYYYSITEDVDVGVVFSPGMYYNKVEDNFSSLVNAGIEKLKELRDTDEITIDIKSDKYDYDIGDIIGANDNITGIRIYKPILKKIIKISKNNINIEYEVNKNGS